MKDLTGIKTIQALQLLIREHTPWLIDRFRHRHLILEIFYTQYHEEERLFVYFADNAVTRRVAVDKLIGEGIFLLTLEDV